jgi:hypothetical protein
MFSPRACGEAWFDPSAGSGDPVRFEVHRRVAAHVENRRDGQSDQHGCFHVEPVPTVEGEQVRCVQFCRELAVRFSPIYVDLIGGLRRCPPARCAGEHHRRHPRPQGADLRAATDGVDSGGVGAVTVIVALLMAGHSVMCGLADSTSTRPLTRRGWW